MRLHRDQMDIVNEPYNTYFNHSLSLNKINSKLFDSLNTNVKKDKNQVSNLG